MRWLFPLGGLILLIFFQVSFSEAVVDRIAAIVNQEIITLSEVEKMPRPLQAEIETEDRLERRERMNEISRKVLERLIEERLIDQEAKRAGIKVTGKEIDSAIEEIKRQHGASQEDLEKALARDGLTPENFRGEIEKQILRAKLVSTAVKVDVPMGEKELRDFYQKNKDRYRSIETYRPAHILLAVPREASPDEVLEIRKKCQDILERIRRGADFGEMALIYSNDISAKDRGELGFFKKGELLPAFEREALRLKMGEVSGIVRTNYGFHIIKLIDRKGGEPLAFEEVGEKVKTDYSNQETEKAFKQFLSTLKAKSVIEIKL